jgi:hypothetical protein
MTSFVRSLLRTSSLTPDTQPGPTRTSFGLRQSPSFNDFSLHVAQDAESEFEDHGAHRANSGARMTRHSSPFPASYPADTRSHLEYLSREGESRLWNGRPPSGASSGAKGLHIPQGKLSYQNHLPSASAPPRAPSRRKREGKIDGMDYYEFCELIRSSSL